MLLVLQKLVLPLLLVVLVPLVQGLLGRQQR